MAWGVLQELLEALRWLRKAGGAGAVVRGHHERGYFPAFLCVLCGVRVCALLLLSCCRFSRCAMRCASSFCTHGLFRDVLAIFTTLSVFIVVCSMRMAKRKKQK